MIQENYELSKEEEDLFNKIDLARKSLQECDDYMRQTQARSVALGIDLTTLEINLFVKKLFLSVCHKVPEVQYQWLSNELMKKMNIIFKVVNEKWGQQKNDESK